MKKIDSYFIFSRSLIFISLSFSLLFSQVSFNGSDIATSVNGVAKIGLFNGSDRQFH